MIFEIIIISLLFVGCNKYIYEKIKKEQDNIERIVEMTALIIFDIFLGIYYIDRLNLPTYFKINSGIETQNWLNIITTCISSIISASIGGLIAFGIARKQIEQNEEQNKENNRIQNLPLLKYDIDTNCKGEANLANIIISNITGKDTASYCLKVNIKNIGQNSIKQLIVDFESDFISKVIRALGENTQNPIEKDGSIELFRCFQLKKGSNYSIELTIFYEDVLQNWYKQSVKIKCETEPKERIPQLNISYTVEEEKRVLSV